MTKKQKNILIRSHLLLPLDEELGLETRIEDGYLLTEGSVIKEVGPYRPEVGERMIRSYGEKLRIIGRTTRPRIEDMLDAQAELISQILPDGTLIYVNRSYREHSDPEGHGLTGRNFMDLLSRRTLSAVRKQLSRLSTEVPVTTYDQRNVGPEGRVTWQE
jgi:PAS domain-containing protein